MGLILKSGKKCLLTTSTKEFIIVKLGLLGSCKKCIRGNVYIDLDEISCIQCGAKHDEECNLIELRGQQNLKRKPKGILK